jgi:hypothetical protein
MVRKKNVSNDRPRRDDHFRFAADRDCGRMDSRAGASPRRSDCCPSDVGYCYRWRARHMAGGRAQAQPVGR